MKERGFQRCKSKAIEECRRKMKRREEYRYKDKHKKENMKIKNEAGTQRCEGDLRRKYI